MLVSSDFYSVQYGFRVIVMFYGVISLLTLFFLLIQAQTNHLVLINCFTNVIIKYIWIYYNLHCLLAIPNYFIGIWRVLAVLSLCQ